MSVHKVQSLKCIFFLSVLSAAKAGSSTSSPGPSSSPAKVSQGSALSAQLCDPQHKDCLFREFRKLCATVAEHNSYNTKTQIIEKFLRKGSAGGRSVGLFVGFSRFLLLDVCLKSSVLPSQISSTEICTWQWSCSCRASWRVSTTSTTSRSLNSSAARSDATRTTWCEIWSRSVIHMFTNKCRMFMSQLKFFKCYW